MRLSYWSSDVFSSDLIPRAPRLAALPLPRMLAVVLFVQMLGAFLAGTFEFGLSHNYSMLRFAEFVAMALLQAVFAGLRPEGRRVGKEGVSMCRSRWSA